MAKLIDVMAVRVPAKLSRAVRAMAAEDQRTVSNWIGLLLQREAETRGLLQRPALRAKGKVE